MVTPKLYGALEVRSLANVYGTVIDPPPMADYLAPSHHRQGIMSDAVDTVLHEWAIPRMKVRHMWVSAFTGNEGSVKVFLKNGFKLIKTHEDFFEVKGKRRGLHLMEWRYNA